MRDVLRRTTALAAVLTVLAAGPAGAQETPSPDASPEAGAVTATGPVVTLEESQRLAELVSAEDERLIDIKAVVASLAEQAPTVPYRVRSAGAYTLVLTARRAAYTLADLRRLAPQTFLELEDGSYLLREHLLLDPGATLSIAPEKATTIRLASSGKGFVSIVNNGGRLRLLGRASAPLTVTSWDETQRAADLQAGDGRAYVRSRGQLVVRHATVSHLGFWSGRTGGLSLSFPGTPQTGAELDASDGDRRTKGVSSTGRQATVLPTGGLPEENGVATVGAEVSDTTLEGNAFGLFVSTASGLRITDVTIRRSLVSGLVLHREVSSAVVQRVTVEGSGLDGVVVTKGVEGTTLSQIDSRGNARDGIRVDGSPMATGPSASGRSMQAFGGNVVATSTVTDNGRTGIRVVGGTNIRVLTNSVTGGPQGIVVDDGAQDVVVEGNQVSGAGANGIHVREASGVDVRGNAVSGSPTGIRLSDARAAVADNTVSGATLHAVTLVGAVAGTTVSRNRLSGAGTSAVDVVRTLPDSDPEVTDNDTTGWAVTLTKDSLLSTLTHPMTLLWLAIGVVVLLTIPLGSRRTSLPTPYPTGPLSPASIPDIEEAQRRALEAVGVLVPQQPTGTTASAPSAATIDAPGPQPAPGTAMFPVLLADQRSWSAPEPSRPVASVPHAPAPAPVPAGAPVAAAVSPAAQPALPVQPAVIDLTAVERETERRRLAAAASPGNELADWIRRLESDR